MASQGVAGAALASIVIPSILIVLGAVGLKKLELQTDINMIWTRKSSQFAKDWEYHKKASGNIETSSSMLLAIAVPRDGGNMMSAANLLELRDRTLRTQQVTVTVDGMVFTFADVCTNVAGAYKYPCYRLTMLDCFKEGDYDFTEKDKQVYQGIVTAQAVGQLKPELIKTGLARSPAACGSLCVFDGQAKAIAAQLGALVGPAGTWEDDANCSACLTAATAPLSPAAKDAVYYSTVKGLIPLLQPSMSPAVVNALPNQVLDASVNNLIVGALKLAGQSPYTWQMGLNLKPQGAPRPSLKNADGSLKTDAEVLEIASSTCYAWDEGQALPTVNQYTTVGGYTPESWQSSRPAKSILTNVKGLETIFLFLRPHQIVERLKSSNAVQHRTGGTLTITEAQAEEVLRQFKEKTEEVFSAGWDNPNDGKVEFTAWSDDAGAGGSTKTLLKDVTMGATTQAVVFFVVVVFLSAAFFFRLSSPLNESRCLLAFVGAILVICSVVAGVGMLAFFGVKWNLTMSYTMPFVMVGILCDDMYMLILSLDDTDPALSPERRFMKAMRTVGVPITVTSTVNFGVFLTLYAVSDLPAIYDAGATGMICTVVAYIAMMGSFSGLVYLDLVRRTSRRWDFGLCCLKANADYRPGGKPAPGKIYKRAFRPIFSTIVGRGVVATIALVLLIVAIVGLTDMKVGTDLEDLYPVGSQSRQFIGNRMKYFPVWPTTLRFGELEYWKPDIQLKMAKAFENVVSTSYVIPGMMTPLLWTAAFARWGMPSSVPAFDKSRSTSPCSPRNTLSSGNCAEALFALHGGPECKATLKENTLGLKLYDKNGFCFPGPMVGIMDSKSYCPVMDLPNAQVHAACLKRWYQYTKETAIASPGIQMHADKITPKVPILISEAGSNAIFVHKLFETSDYTTMMKETRQYMDDDKSMHSWMHGIAFAYWEQYLTIVGFMWGIGAWAAGAGFVISFLFLFLELTVNKYGRAGPRLACCFLGAVLITTVLVASMITVWGWMSIFKVKLSAFSAMAILFASGFAIEYAAHIVHHFLECQDASAVARVDYAMVFLFKPTLMAVASSLASVLVLAFSKFGFVTTFFFLPLLIVVIVTYFFGVIFLPCVLSCLGCLPRLEKRGTSLAAARFDGDEEESSPSPSPAVVEEETPKPAPQEEEVDNAPPEEPEESPEPPAPEVPSKPDHDLHMSGESTRESKNKVSL